LGFFASAASSSASSRISFSSSSFFLASSASSSSFSFLMASFCYKKHKVTLIIDGILYELKFEFQFVNQLQLEIALQNCIFVLTQGFLKSRQDAMGMQKLPELPLGYRSGPWICNALS
jgi:hypothetical protein